MCTNSWFDPLHFDLALCSFIESVWEEGDSENEAIDCVRHASLPAPTEGESSRLKKTSGGMGQMRITSSGITAQHFLFWHLRVKPSP